MTEHQIVLMIQRQRAALIAERDALREQVAALAAERDALQVENQELRAVLTDGPQWFDCFCPWCGGHYTVGHKPDCQRQVALSKK